MQKKYEIISLTQFNITVMIGRGDTKIQLPRNLNEGLILFPISTILSRVNKVHALPGSDTDIDI